MAGATPPSYCAKKGDEAPWPGDKERELLQNITIHFDCTLPECQNPNLPNWEKGLKIAFYMPAMFLAVFGNWLVLLIVIKNKKMRNTTTLYIMNLAISDLLIGMFAMWIHLGENLYKKSFYPFGSFICRTNQAIQSACLVIFFLQHPLGITKVNA